MTSLHWAYQVENFVSEPDEEFVCSICCAIFCDPVACSCNHVFCRVCITKWLQNNRNCPICRTRVSSESVEEVVPNFKNLIMKLVLYCRNKTLGCKEQFCLESCESHVKECLYELVQCKNNPCKVRIIRKDITAHEKRKCRHRYKRCQKCDLKIATSALPENHDCIRALQQRLRKKKNGISRMIVIRNHRIQELEEENKALKTALQNSSHPQTSGAVPSTSSTPTPAEMRGTAVQKVGQVHRHFKVRYSASSGGIPTPAFELISEDLRGTARL